MVGGWGWWDRGRVGDGGGWGWWDRGRVDGGRVGAGGIEGWREGMGSEWEGGMVGSGCLVTSLPLEVTRCPACFRVLCLA
jgi:hypothetical protein